MLSFIKIGVFSNNPRAELTFNYYEDLMKKVNKILIEKQRNSSRHDKSKQQNIFSVSQEDPLKEDHLRKFLSIKMQFFNENLDKMIIPELGSTLDRSINIIKSISKQPESFKIGIDHCQMDKSDKENISPLCPWHWLINERENIFPFTRAVANCNCKECQARTFDKSINATACEPLITPTPALYRESIENGTENWKFVLEEVPTSCFCSVSFIIQSK